MKWMKAVLCGVLLGAAGTTWLASARHGAPFIHRASPYRKTPAGR